MNSKKLSIVLLLAMGLGNTSFASVVPAADCASHVYVPRAASTDLTWIDALLFYNRTREYPDKKYIYSGTTIYQQSRKSAPFSSSFLLGNSLNTLPVAQVPTAGAVNAIELGLGNLAPAAPFASVLTISPVRKQFSYVGNMYFNLEDWWCGLWGDFTFGVTNAHHKLNCCEVGNTSTACAGISTVGEALSSPFLDNAFYCGTCSDGKRRTGLEDAQLRLGYDYLWCNDNRVGIYIIGTIPAGRTPTSQYIFEPLVGSKHGSVGAGFLADYQFNFCGCEDSNLTLMTDFNYRYVLKHNECRTFDLLPNGAFSRYILLVNSTALGSPFAASSVTTVKAQVTPRSTIQWWLGLNYEYCNWDLEIGYNLFWRQQEQVKYITDPCNPFPTTVGVYNLNSSGLSPVTASNATMFSTGTSDATFVALTPADLNLASGAAGRVLSNKVYGAFSWTGCACNCLEWMAGFGASYEFVSNKYKCAAPQNWAVFGKWAVGF